MKWLGRFWSKLIKIPFFLRRQMRRREKKIMRILPHMKSEIYKKIPQEVLIEHRVTQAGKDQVTVGKEAKKVEKAEVDLGFDEEVEETLSLNEIRKIEKILIAHEEAHGATGYEEKFGKNTINILGGAEAEDRKIYFTYIEPIIKVAEKEGNYKALMEQIRLLGPSQTTPFAAIALRLDIRAASKGISKLRHDKAAIDKSLREWDKAKGNKEVQANHIRAALAETEKDVQGVLHSDALIAKRDFLLTLLTLKMIDDDEELMREYYMKHVMPKLPEEERIQDFEELKKKFAEDMHVLAQGMRRILAAEKDAEKLAGEIEAVAHTKRKAA